MTTTTATISPRARCAKCKATKAAHDKDPRNPPDGPTTCGSFVEKPKRMSRVDEAECADLPRGFGKD